MANDRSNGVNGDQKFIAPTPKVLAEFFNQVKKGFIDETVKVQGFEFVISTPTEDAETWADNFIKPNSPVAFLSSRRVPRLAVAIRSINGQPVDTMFSYPSGMTKAERDRIEESEDNKRYWVYSQLMAQLAQLPPPVIEELYKHYSKLLDKRDTILSEVVGADPNDSSRTPGGASAATS